MPLKHSNEKRNVKEPTLLSIDRVTFAQVLEVKKDKISLLFRTKLKFENLFNAYGMNECLKYGKLSVSVDRVFPDVPSISENNSQNILSFNLSERQVEVSNSEENQESDEEIKKIISQRFTPAVESLLFTTKYDEENQTKNNKASNFTRVAYVENDFSDKIININNVSYSFFEIRESKKLKTRTKELALDSELNNSLEELNESLKDPTDIFALDSLKLKDYRIQFKNYIQNNVIKSAENFEQIIYERKKVTKNLFDIDIETIVSIPRSLSKEVLRVTLKVFQLENSDDLSPSIVKNGNISKPTESTTLELNIPYLLESQKVLQHFPQLYIKEKVSDVSGKRNVTVHVMTHDEDIAKVNAYNVYVKNISANGNCDDFYLAAQIPGHKGFSEISLYSSLCIVRVVPLDNRKEEYSTFTSKVCGTRFKLANHVINQLTLVPFGTANGNTNFSIYNIPTEFNKINLFRRDCTNSQYNNFSLISQYHIDKNTSKMLVNDADYHSGNTFEYYVEAYSTERNKKTHSNIILYKHPRPNYLDVKLQTKFNNEGYFRDFSKNDSLNFSFEVENSFVNDYNSSISNVIQNQDGAANFYDRNFNPSINESNPVKDEKTYVAFHEVSRYDLATKEVQTFDLITTKFEDNDRVRTLQNISPLYSDHKYVYVVTSYVRDAKTIVPNLVKSGVNSTGENWFYSPYKWKNPEVIKTGRLYADSTNPEFRTEIPDYEALTSDYYGITAVRQPEIEKIPDVIDNLSAEIIDLNTVKVSWKSYQGYDTFMVAKIVNGQSTLIGRTSKNYYYAKLDYDDFGSVSYAIVPISKNYDLAAAEISNTLYIGFERNKKVSKKSIEVAVR